MLNSTDILTNINQLTHFSEITVHVFPVAACLTKLTQNALGARQRADLSTSPCHTNRQPHSKRLKSSNAPTWWTCTQEPHESMKMSMKIVRISCVSLISSHSMFPFVLAANCWGGELIPRSSVHRIRKNWDILHLNEEWKYESEPFKQTVGFYTWQRWYFSFLICIWQIKLLYLFHGRNQPSCSRAHI